MSELERMEAEYRAMLLSLPPETRLLMAFSMFDTARALVLASLPADASAQDIRRHLLKRFYPEISRELIPDLND